MTYHTYLPAGFLAVALIAGGTMVATAQETAQETAPRTAQSQMSADAPKPPVQQARGRGHDHGGHRGAGPDGAIFERILTEADTNGDGRLTSDELTAYRTATVTEADASGDGALSLDEFQTIWMEVMNERMVDAFQRLDADGSGSIDEAEIDRPMARMIDRMDRDGDGTLERPGRRG